jgi:hypothetical protein
MRVLLWGQSSLVKGDAEDGQGHHDDSRDYVDECGMGEIQVG